MPTNPNKISIIENLSNSFPHDRNGNARFALLLHNVFTQEECQALIDKSEKNGYVKAFTNPGTGRQVMNTEFRNSDRSILFDPAFAVIVYQRILASLKDTVHKDVLRRAPWIPTWNMQYLSVGCNERISFLRYDPGHYFKPHNDGMFRRLEGPRKGEISFVTLQLYLNEGFQGGATTFFCPGTKKKLIEVVPKIGSVLIFEHNLLHEGSKLMEGRKYTLRTDIMYTTKGPGHEYSVDTAGLTYPDNSSDSQKKRADCGLLVE